MNDPIIQCQLLAEETLSFKTTMELSQGMESAARNVKELTGQQTGDTDNSDTVLKVNV